MARSDDLAARDSPGRGSARGVRESVLLVAIGVVLLGVAAWSASKATTGGSSPDISATVPGNEAAQNDALLVTVGALAAALVILVAPALLRSGRRKAAAIGGDDEPRETQLWVRLIAGVFIMLAVVFVILLAVRKPPEPIEPLPVAPAPTVTVQPEASERPGARGWTAFALVSAGAIAVFTAVAVLHRRGRASGPMPDAEGRASSEPPRPIDFESLAPADAVRAVYAAARVALEPMGVLLRPPESPYEYLDRVRAVAPTVERPVATLTRLFEVARFSHHPVTAEMKADAIAAYHAVAGEVARSLEAARTLDAAQAHDTGVFT